MTNQTTKTREHGPRVKITCNLPHPSRYRVSNGETLETIAGGILTKLETALCKYFGGYTATPSAGGWMNELGELVHESGTLYNVSFMPGAKLKEAIALFTEAGESLGEEWIHIERSEFQAEHRKTANGSGEYNNAPCNHSVCSQHYIDTGNRQCITTNEKPPHDGPEKHDRKTCPRCLLNANAERVQQAAIKNIERIRQLTAT